MKSLSTFININEKEVWDSENIYHLKTDTSRISRLIYHYEIYKMITTLPGDIIECGVFKGISLTRFLSFRKILENDKSRKVYGFDAFGKFPSTKNKIDKKVIDNWTNKTGDGISVDELNQIFLKKNFTNYSLIKGDIFKTIPDFLKKNPQIKISLLHLDLDIYEPTKFALRKLFNYVVKGGVILLDDYNGVYGATKAVDEFLKINNNLKIYKLSFERPSYILKS